MEAKNVVLKKHKKSTANLKRETLQKIILYILTVLGAAVMIVPFLWMISTSLKTKGATMVLPPQLLPESISWENYVRVFTEFPMIKFFLNSVVVSVAATLGQLLLCSMAAYVFARIPFKGRNALFLLFLATLMVPMQVIMIPEYIIVNKLGWLNTYQGLIVPQIFMGSAFGTFLLRQFFLSIPKELEEAAFIDGAGYFRIYWNIILPHAKPAMAALAIFSFMQTWNNFLWPLIAVSDKNMMTLPLGLSLLQGRWGTDWNLMMSGVVVSIIPIVMVYLFSQKYFIRGIALSGMK